MNHWIDDAFVDIYELTYEKIIIKIEICEAYLNMHLHAHIHTYKYLSPTSLEASEIMLIAFCLVYVNLIVVSSKNLN